MRNKEVYTQILKLTSEKEWMDCPKTVKKVQDLGELVIDGSSTRIDYKKVNGIAVFDEEKQQLRRYSTIQECIKYEQLSRASISRRIRRKCPSLDGRTFSIF